MLRSDLVQPLFWDKIQPGQYDIGHLEQVHQIVPSSPSCADPIPRLAWLGFTCLYITVRQGSQASKSGSCNSLSFSPPFLPFTSHPHNDTYGSYMVHIWHIYDTYMIHMGHDWVTSLFFLLLPFLSLLSLFPLLTLLTLHHLLLFLSLSFLSSLSSLSSLSYLYSLSCLSFLFSLSFLSYLFYLFSPFDISCLKCSLFV